MKLAFGKKMTVNVSKVVDQQSSINKYKDVNWSVFNTLILNIKILMPSSCRRGCCKESIRDRLFKRAYTKYRKEIEITNMIKTIRTLKAQTKKNFSKIQWRLFKLKQGSRRIHVVSTNDKIKEDKIFK